MFVCDCWFGSALFQRGLSSEQGQVEFNLWPAWAETCPQMRGCGSLHPDYHSLINSPGHVVYIFRCKVEGLYLRMARFESTERERMLFWITPKCKPGRIADISIWIQKTAEINRPHIHYWRVTHKQQDFTSSNKHLCLLLKAVPIYLNEYDQYSK